MQRLRLYDCRNSRLPQVVGKCQSDIVGIRNYVNSAQRRLLMAKEAGEEGWWGTWGEIVFNVSRATPYITLPREVARLMAITVCDRPVPIQNQFFEYTQFGNGRFPKNFCCRDFLQGYSRNNAVTFTDLSNAPQFLMAIASNAQDFGKRILFQGRDANDNVIYSQDDRGQRITGEFSTFTDPFVVTPQMYSSIFGIQKDVTMGPVRIYQVDPSTGDQVLLLTMEPGEQTASYRRYYFNGLPCMCCPSPNAPCTQVQVTAIAKLDLIPVTADTDYCLIQNLEAIIEECASVRYSEMDSPQAKTMAAERHIQAIRMLNGELSLYLGRDDVAIQVWPFGSARLEKRRIGTLI